MIDNETDQEYSPDDIENFEGLARPLADSLNPSDSEDFPLQRQHPSFTRRRC